MTAPYFSAFNLRKTAGSFSLSLSFSAEQGTMTVIAGPSGSGKSTALRLIAGLERCDEAAAPCIMLNGANITALPPESRHIGMVFQSHALFEHLTVRDNVAYGLRSAGMSRAESRKRADAYLAQFGLAGFGSRWPGTLSGGEAQRVSLARTLILKPRLILFDEPLSSLDEPLRKKLVAEIRAMQQQTPFTGIWVTHDIAEAKAVADSVFLIKHGTIVWTGLPEQFNESLYDRQ